MVSEDFQLAAVDVAGELTGVNVGLLAGSGGVRPGDWVLVHIGFAVSRLDDDQASDALRLLSELRES